MVEKVCCTCKGGPKPLSDFYKDKGAKDGHEARCKVCRKKSAQVSYFNHHEKNKMDRSWWGKENRDKHRVSERRYYREHYAKDPGKFTAKVNLRRCLRTQRTPSWVNRDDLREVYRNCPRGMDVDHIVALNAKLNITLGDGSPYLIEASGLHVPWNLRYMIPSENRRKTNKLVTE